MKEAVAPVEHTVDEGPFRGDVTMEHPGFGMLQVIRWTSNQPVRMNGSHLGHRAGLTITLSTSKVSRRHGVDYQTSEDIVAEVTLSESQWARFVSSVGDGSGIPATINMRQQGPLQRIPPIAVPRLTQSERHGQEIKEDLDEALARINEQIAKLGEMIESGKTGKKDLRELHHAISIQASNLPANAKYAMDTFVRSSAKVTEQAFVEVDAYVNGVARRVGLENLRQMSPLVPGPEDKGLVIENDPA